ncbi:probable amino acid permease 7 [Benincasa hispida]|uniref:probable amino acid permease 7 n=1 Tax=Benincasa hispida TaxID=102211 RepID=UPI0019025230|nr:probable amino acid permease 7 [Benincasa hispida]
MGGVDNGEEPEALPFIVETLSCSHDQAEEQLIQRNGDLRTAIAHIITGVIGAGVLSLPWSVAQLGWIAGPVLLGVVFPTVTSVLAFLLCDCYRYPDPEVGHFRIKSYPQAVKLYLGEKWEQICTVNVMISFWFTDVAYLITTASSIRAIEKLICYHREGDEAFNSCTVQEDSSYQTIIFGAVQIMLSQIPDMHNMGWLSIFATIMSFSYSTIAIVLGLSQVLENGSIKGNISGIPAANLTEKLFIAFEAIGDIAFAYPFTLILLNIQDTLKSPPPENQTMKKATTIAISVTTLFYLCCASFGYAAFGDATPGNLLTEPAFFHHFWLLAFANACVVLHLLGGYQIYSQPVFSIVERWTRRNYPNNNVFMNRQSSIKLPMLPAFKLHPFRLCFRTAFVLSTTYCAVLFPYFNQVLGLIGALNFWPFAIYFPLEMFFKQRKIRAWTRTWIAFRVLSFVCFLVTVMGCIGSLERIISTKFS